jgi:hypothetical protein
MNRQTRLNEIHEQLVRENMSSSNIQVACDLLSVLSDDQLFVTSCRFWLARPSNRDDEHAGQVRCYNANT